MISVISHSPLKFKVTEDIIVIVSKYSDPASLLKQTMDELAYVQRPAKVMSIWDGNDEGGLGNLTGDENQTN